MDLNYRCYIIAVTLIPEKSIVILRGPTKCYAQDYDFMILRLTLTGLFLPNKVSYTYKYHYMLHSPQSLVRSPKSLKYFVDCNAPV